MANVPLCAFAGDDTASHRPREGARMIQPMILHWSPRSPYVRKVMIAIHEMGLQDRVRTVRTVTGGTTPHRALMKINPVGKIPTLELSDGTAIYARR
jgi:hypothetical protein